MPINLDMGNVKSGPAPAGMYLLRILECEVKPNKAGDGDYLNLKFTIMEPEEEIGRAPLYHTISLKPQSRPFLQQFLEAATKEEWREDGLSFEPADVINQFVWAAVDSTLDTRTKAQKNVIRQFFQDPDSDV